MKNGYKKALMNWKKATIIFLVIIFIFNFRLIKELFNHQVVSATNDALLSEFIDETGYQKLLQLTNPFSFSNKIIYPFGVNLDLNRPSVVTLLFFLVLRPLFNPYKSLIIIKLVDLILNNLIMYAFLRNLKIKPHSAVLSSLIFSFTPFLGLRITGGHYSYTCLFFFPLIFLIFKYFNQTKNKLAKFLLSLSLGLTLSVFMLSSFFYFIGLSLMVSFYGFYFLILKRKTLFSFLKTSFVYILNTFLSLLLSAWPWLTSFLEHQNLTLATKSSFIRDGSLILSADLLNFFIPSEKNPFYKFLVNNLVSKINYLIKLADFFSQPLQNSRLVYPGIIIILIYCYLLIFRNKIDRRLKAKISPYLAASIFLSSLTLGPLLKIFNRWTISLEGVYVYFPLPFLILKYLPILGMVRAPTRLIVPAIFLASTITAFVLDSLFFNQGQSKKNLVFGLILIIFFLDQSYTFPNKINKPVPIKAYEYIKNDPQFGTMLEIPFTVRDGLQYIGFVHAISPLKGIEIHQKPIIGGYTARVNEAAFNYYRNLPLIGYLAQIIDQGNYNPNTELPKPINFFPPDYKSELVQKELDFLSLRYLLLKNDEEYSQPLKSIIEDLGFRFQLQDNNYWLFVREIGLDSFNQVEFSSVDDHLYTAGGFSIKEDGFRWADKKVATVFIKPDKGFSNLNFTAVAFLEPQQVKIYLNQKLIREILIDVNKKDYHLELGQNENAGLNTINFKFSKSFKPKEVFKNNQDERSLSVSLYSLEVD